MNRRDFCKKSTLLGLGALFFPGRLFARDHDNAQPVELGEWEVEVVRRECFRDLQCRYCDNPEAGRCEKFRVGDRFEIDFSNVGRSGGDLGRRCPKLWQSLASAVEGNSNNDADCQRMMEGDGYVVSCPDGTRPVIVKLRRKC